jgi:hypothetical protein
MTMRVYYPPAKEVLGHIEHHRRLIANLREQLIEEEQILEELQKALVEAQDREASGQPVGFYEEE